MKSETEKLLKEYEELLFDLETQSCQHGENGNRKTGEDYQSCCGISYEYLNDIGCRAALENIIDSLPPADAKKLQEIILPLDSRLKQLIKSGIPWAVNETKYPRGKYWWLYGLPKGVNP